MHAKWKTLLLVPLFFLLIGLPAHGAETPNNQNQDQDQNQQRQAVKLTKQQQAEISKLHLDILDKKKQLISKYVEFGVIPKEKGEKILAKLDEHYNEIKENGFVPHWNKMHHHHHDHHEHDNDDQE